MRSLPSLFVSHGAPTFALEPGIAGPMLSAVARSLPRPRAILILSPHWMTREVLVSAAAAPVTIYDFSGFDRALYDIRYPAPGAPVLARLTAELLQRKGWNALVDQRRGLDHGAWVPLRYLFPAADIPVFQVSLPVDLSSESAFRLGESLAPLAEQGVLIVGSGSLTHNLYEFQPGEPNAATYAREFEQWIRSAVKAGERERLIHALHLAPHARRAHPTSEHFLPLLVALGAAPAPLPVTVVPGGFTHGVLSMESYVFGAELAFQPDGQRAWLNDAASATPALQGALS